MKILCLILDSDPIESWRDTYFAHRLTWLRCLSKCPNVDGFFVRSNPDLSQETETIRGIKHFSVRQTESFGTVMNKLTSAIDNLLDDHDYVIQTGLSSLYDFNLLRQRMPAFGVYAGHLVDGTYVTGAGILMSADVARMLVEDRHKADSEWQDVSIQRILQARGIQAQHEEMFIYNYAKSADQIETGKHVCYRFRDYSDPNRAREREAHLAVFDRLYG